jgi:GGDEF domain-containing protein
MSDYSEEYRKRLQSSISMGGVPQGTSDQSPEVTDEEAALEEQRIQEIMDRKRGIVKDEPETAIPAAEAPPAPDLGELAAYGNLKPQDLYDPLYEGAPEGVYKPEAYSDLFRDRIAQAEDPLEEENRLNSAYYVSMLEGVSFDDAYNNLEAYTQAYYGKAQAPKNWHQAIKTTWQAATIGIEVAKLAYQLGKSGGTDQALVDRIRELESYIPEQDMLKRSLPVESLKAAAQFLPSQIESLKAGFGMGAAGAAGAAGALSVGAALGLSFTGIGAIAIPAVLLMGFRAGNAVGAMQLTNEIETGALYWDLLRTEQKRTVDGKEIIEKVNPQVAWAVAQVHGAIAGVTEMLPADEFVLGAAKAAGLNKAIKKAVKETSSTVAEAATRSGVVQRVFKKFMASKAANAAKEAADIGTETLQEVVQETSAILSAEYAKQITNRLEGTELTPIERNEVRERINQTLVQSIMGMTAMKVIPGSMKLFFGAGQTAQTASKAAKVYKAEELDHGAFKLKPEDLEVYEKRVQEGAPQGLRMVRSTVLEGEEYALSAVDGTTGKTLATARYEFEPGKGSKPGVMRILGLKGGSSPATNMELMKSLAYNFAGWDIEFSPKSANQAALKALMIKMNPRGEAAGLTWYTIDPAIPEGVTREYMDQRIQQVAPSWGEQDRSAAINTLGMWGKRFGMTGEEMADAIFAPGVFVPQLVRGDGNRLESGKVLTPEMIAQGAAGATTWRYSVESLKALVDLAPTANVSTFLHETTHAVTSFMLGVRDGQIKVKNKDVVTAELAAIERALGVENGDWDAEFKGWTAEAVNPNRTYWEAFTYAMEDYLVTGKAPKPELQSVFERFKQWILDIYKGLKGARVEMNPELEAYFDDLFGDSAALWNQTPETSEGLQTSAKETSQVAEPRPAAGSEGDEDLDLFQGQVNGANPKGYRDLYQGLTYKTDEVLEKKPWGKMPGRQILATLKAAGVKGEELEWTGLEEFLATDEKLTPAQVKEHLDANRLEISENIRGYSREKEYQKGKAVALAEGFSAEEYSNAYGALANQVVPDYAEFGRIGEIARPAVEMKRNPQGTKYENYVLPGGDNYREVLFTLPNKLVGDGMGDVMWARGNYSSPHWAEVDVLAHTRLNDRTDSQGRSLLFVEEIQSDWHQEGRKRGYKSGAKTILSPFGGEVPATMEDAKRVPDAPFKKTWHEFVFKKILREAADNRYDAVAWTTGEQQAERYDLSKQIDELAWIPAGEDKPGYGRLVGSWRDTDVIDQYMAETAIEEYVGKEIANKLLTTPRIAGESQLRGIDLKFGGEGMRGFYDKILVDYANKLGKKWGVQVEKRQLSPGSIEFVEDEEAMNELTPIVHALPITDEMRDSILRTGLSLFQGEKTKAPGTNERKNLDGTIEVRPDERVERRGAFAKATKDMNAEELREAIRANPVSAIPGKVAYREDTAEHRAPIQVSLDLDSLKWINDNLGHEAGDEMLRTTALVLNDVAQAHGLQAYHLSGDEYALTGEDIDEVLIALAEVDEKLKSVILDTDIAPDVKAILRGPRITYGVDGEGDLRAADERLGEAKRAKEARGERAARGEIPGQIDFIRKSDGQALDRDRAREILDAAQRDTEEARGSSTRGSGGLYSSAAIEARQRALIEQRRQQAQRKTLLSVVAHHGAKAGFDKFDLGYLGTGEGQQVYGWGIYLTENKGVARNHYADRLGGEPVLKFARKDGKGDSLKFDHRDTGWRRVLTAMKTELSMLPPGTPISGPEFAATFKDIFMRVGEQEYRRALYEDEVKGTFNADSIKHAMKWVEDNFDESKSASIQGGHWLYEVAINTKGKTPTGKYKPAGAGWNAPIQQGDVQKILDATKGWDTWTRDDFEREYGLGSAWDFWISEGADSPGEFMRGFIENLLTNRSDGDGFKEMELDYPWTGAGLADYLTTHPFNGSSTYSSATGKLFAKAGLNTITPPEGGFPAKITAAMLHDLRALNHWRGWTMDQFKAQYGAAPDSSVAREASSMGMSPGDYLGGTLEKLETPSDAKEIIGGDTIATLYDHLTKVGFGKGLTSALFKEAGIDKDAMAGADLMNTSMLMTGEADLGTHIGDYAPPDIVDVWANLHEEGDFGEYGFDPYLTWVRNTEPDGHKNLLVTYHDGRTQLWGVFDGETDEEIDERLKSSHKKEITKYKAAQLESLEESIKGLLDELSNVLAMESEFIPGVDPNSIEAWLDDGGMWDPSTMPDDVRAHSKAVTDLVVDFLSDLAEPSDTPAGAAVSPETRRAAAAILEYFEGPDGEPFLYLRPNDKTPRGGPDIEGRWIQWEKTVPRADLDAIYKMLEDLINVVANEKTESVPNPASRYSVMNFTKREIYGGYPTIDAAQKNRDDIAARVSDDIRVMDLESDEAKPYLDPHNERFNAGDYFTFSSDYFITTSTATSKLVEVFGQDLVSEPDFNEGLMEALNDIAIFIEAAKGITGQELYRTIAGTFGAGDQEPASRILQAAGFDGVRYPVAFLTGGTGDKGSNYVVFDDESLVINRRTFWQGEGIGAPLATPPGSVTTALLALTTEKMGVAEAATSRGSIGPIAIPWGWEGREGFTDGFGLSKILRKHRQDNVMAHLKDILEKGAIYSDPTAPERRRLIIYKTYRAVINLYRDGEQQGPGRAWLMTCYIPEASRSTGNAIIPQGAELIEPGEAQGGDARKVYIRRTKHQAEGWHGTHAAFDRFSTDHIGSGEGAQAYGWGLYFTENESVAKDYAYKGVRRKIYEEGREETIGGRPVRDYDHRVQAAMHHYTKSKRDAGELPSAADAYEYLSDLLSDWPREEYEAYYTSTLNAGDYEDPMSPFRKLHRDEPEEVDIVVATANNEAQLDVELERNGWGAAPIEIKRRVKKTDIGLALDALERGDVEFNTVEGKRSLYEVKLWPDREAVLLHWEEPLGEQPEETKAALAKLGIKIASDDDWMMASDAAEDELIGDWDENLPGVSLTVEWHEEVGEWQAIINGGHLAASAATEEEAWELGEEARQDEEMRQAQMIETDLRNNIDGRERDERAMGILEEKGLESPFRTWGDYWQRWIGEEEEYYTSEVEASQDISNQLMGAGIDGVRVPVNWNSGGRGEGGYNYVVFDEDEVQIIHHTLYMAQRTRESQENGDPENGQAQLYGVVRTMEAEGKTWEAFMEYVEDTKDWMPGAVSAPPNLDPEAKATWYRTVWDEALKDAKKPADLNEWLKRLAESGHGQLKAFLKALWDEVLVREREAEMPGYTEEDAALWAQERERAFDIRSQIAEPIIAGAINAGTKGARMAPAFLGSLMGIIRANPEEYAAIYGEVMHDDAIGQLGAALAAAKFEDIEGDERVKERMGISERAALAAQIRDEKLEKKILAGLVTGTDLKNYVDGLRKAAAKDKEKLEQLRVEIKESDAIADARTKEIADARKQLAEAKLETRRINKRIRGYLDRNAEIPASLESQKRKIESQRETLKRRLAQANDFEQLTEDLEKAQAKLARAELAVTQARARGDDTPAPVLKSRSEAKAAIAAIEAKLKMAKEYKNSAQLQTYLAKLEAETKLKDKIAMRDASRRAAKKIRAHREALVKSIMKKAGDSVAVAYAKDIRAIQAAIDPTSPTKATQEKIDLLRSELEANPVLSSEIPRRWMKRALGKNLNEMTFEELEATERRVRELREAGRAEKARRDRERQEDNEAYRTRIAEIVMGLPGYKEPTGYEPEKDLQAKMLEKFREFNYGWMNAQRFAERMDGGKQGQNYELLILERDRHYREEMANAERRKRAILEGLKERGINTADWFNTTVTIVGAGPARSDKTLRKTDLLAIEMAFRNEDSRQAVLFGDFFSAKEKEQMDEDELYLEGGRRFGIIRAALDANLTAVDLEALDAIFRQDAQEAGPRLAATVAEVSNKEFISVDDYFPLRRQGVTQEPMDVQVAGDILDRTAGQRRPPKNGFTKERIKINPAHQAPVKLDLLTTWMESIDAQEHYLATAAYGKRLDAYYLDTFVQEQIRAAMGDTGVKYLKEYITEIKNPGELRNRNPWETSIRGLRGNLGVAYLAFRTSSVMKQLITSPWPALPYAGPRLFTEAMKMMLNPVKYVRDTEELSIVLQNRSQDMVFEAIKENAKAHGIEKGLDKISKVGMKGLELVDRLCVSVGWRAMYEAELARNGGDAEKALAFADDNTLRTQPSSRGVDLAPIYRNAGEGTRLLLQFTQALNVVYQNLRYDIPTAVRNHQWGAVVGTITGYMIAGVLLNAATGRPPEDESDEEKLNRLLFWSFTQATDSLPLIGQEATRVMKRAITGEKEPMLPDTALPGISNVLDGMYRLSGGEIERAMVEFATGGGMIMGIPVSGFREVIRAAQGDTGALLGKPKEK